MADFVASLEAEPLRPDFADALEVQRVLDAVELSAAQDSRYTPVQRGEVP